MSKIETEENNSCFIITPIGSEGGAERRFADGITNAVLRPVLKEFNLEPIVAHEISATGSINDQVIEHIYKDKLAICNLTGLNSNVMYELGIRYTMRKHTILICEEGTRLPFDIIAERTIFYTNDIAGSTELQFRLKTMISGINFEEEPINPIFRVLDFDTAMGKIKEQDADSAIIGKLKNLLDSYSSSNIEKTDDFGIAVIEKLGGNPISEENFREFSLNILNDSKQTVYPSKSLWLSSSRSFVLKYGTKLSIDESASIINNAVFKTFGKHSNVRFL